MTEIAPRKLATVAGVLVPVPDPDRLVHLQFRRFAGCPVCNLHLRSFVTRHAEVAAAGVREVVLFHSPAEELRPHAEGLPFAVVADPDKRQYVEFGVESAPRALLDPRAWGPIVRGVLRDLGPVLRGRRPRPSLDPHGGRLGLPADFLIGRDGTVLASKHGTHAYDQWSVDELLSRVRAASTTAGRQPS
ncbi:peroxiredoxin-like family protein [Actinophytocola sp.]|uniref:peroxiredoxin-like family protein n=1 Tax=Actinophytocola sp. TaxID=1872138 RepID=UPI002D7F0B34|nr:peroxiredoxin-like family protein [Actinophytocola sp.]HET9141520.1 peroxiredoxin-like family protein [Actinophytocola sp.]